MCVGLPEVSSYLGSLEERVRRQLLEFIRCDVKAVQLLQQGEGPLWDEVQHVVVQAERMEAGHFLQETIGESRRSHLMQPLRAAAC